MFSRFLSCFARRRFRDDYSTLASSPAASRELKVGADPNNMPFSNDR